MYLDIPSLCVEAAAFSGIESAHPEPSLYGITDGKAVGTYLEAKFVKFLQLKGYLFELGNAASGLDLPGLMVDIKTTSVNKPQSSCPFRDIRQKIYGLGYSLIVFVYSKSDDQYARTATLSIRDAIFIQAEQTGDFQMTHGLLDILRTHGSVDDLASFMQSRALMDDYAYLEILAEEVRRSPPTKGYLTISPAMQWRLAYGHAIREAGVANGLELLYRGVA